MKPPAMKTVKVASQVRGHHHASVAFNRRVPKLLVADTVVSEAFLCPLANLNRAVVVGSDYSVALTAEDLLKFR